MLNYGILIKNYKTKYFYIDFLRALVLINLILIEYISSDLFLICLTFIICICIYLFEKL